MHRSRPPSSPRSPGRDGLLVVDNCEHLLDGVRELRRADPRRLPARSRCWRPAGRALVVPYERVYQVPGLSVTEDGGDAVDLFVARVAAATGERTAPDRRRVAALCRALDGSALAIELAAARFSTLGLDGLEDALDDRLRFLTGGTRIADRHRSLRDAIGWSYDLLAAGGSRPAQGRRRAGIVVRRRRRPCRHGLERRTALWWPTGWPAWPATACSSSQRGEPTRYRALETIRQYGVEQPRRRRRAGRRPRPPRAVVSWPRSLRWPLGRVRRRMVRAVRSGRRRCPRRAALVRRRRAAPGGGGVARR